MNVSSLSLKYHRGSVDPLELRVPAALLRNTDCNAHCLRTLRFRLWFLSAVGRGLTLQPPAAETVPSEIGYMNVIPKCIDCSGKYPHYENLPETYSAINVYLAANPLEG